MRIVLSVCCQVTGTAPIKMKVSVQCFPAVWLQSNKLITLFGLKIKTPRLLFVWKHGLHSFCWNCDRILESYAYSIFSFLFVGKLSEDNIQSPINKGRIGVTVVVGVTSSLASSHPLTIPSIDPRLSGLSCCLKRRRRRRRRRRRWKRRRRRRPGFVPAPTERGEGR